jgi:hypothetical protein
VRIPVLLPLSGGEKLESISRRLYGTIVAGRGRYLMGYELPLIHWVAL